ncbi:hypothetical protein NDU88_004040 [Pleurodeles waltl]|uniref:Uncharacterized protein n=1 Tax=Pleurodeles waltl TaxID=8319 RepID=A0AAV7W466_PLEWA|nr:hypothetical protein NDU88_004040 [Pleurodeles waltl]
MEGGGVPRAGAKISEKRPIRSPCPSGHPFGGIDMTSGRGWCMGCGGNQVGDLGWRSRGRWVPGSPPQSSEQKAGEIHCSWDQGILQEEGAYINHQSRTKEIQKALRAWEEAHQLHSTAQEVDDEVDFEEKRKGKNASPLLVAPEES